MLVNPPALAYLNYEWPLLLHTDASKDGLGAVLEHEQDDGQMNPEAYVSRYVSVIMALQTWKRWQLCGPQALPGLFVWAPLCDLY